MDKNPPTSIPKPSQIEIEGVKMMIYRDLLESFRENGSAVTIVDNELQYTDSGTIPEHCMQLAGEYEKRIVALLAGKDLSEQWKRDRLFINIMYFYRNIPDKSNNKIEEWLNADDKAAKIFTTLTVEYESAGWNDIATAPFNHENETSIKLLEELYQNAVAFFKKEVVKN